MEDLEEKVIEILNERMIWDIFSDRFTDTAHCIEAAMREIAIYYFNKGKEQK